MADREANSEFDPWRSASVSSEFRPGGPLPSRREAPVYLLGNATHCIDLVVKNGLANNGVMGAQQSAMITMRNWITEFYLRPLGGYPASG
jgi:hypothetical protein